MTIEIHPVAIEKDAIQSINLPLQSVDFSGESNHKVTPLIQKIASGIGIIGFFKAKAIVLESRPGTIPNNSQNIETPVRLFDVFG